MKKLIPLFAAALVLAPMFFMHSCANTTEAPTGGLKDTIPPYITDISPLPGTAGVPVSGARFVFTFNEYVTIKTPANILLSPPQQKPLKSRLQGKKLVVTTEEDLIPGITYTISFVDAIADANEGNVFPGYTYAFSTGSKVDSMIITGTVRDCNTLLPKKGATVMLYKDHSDSAVFLHRPYATARTDDWGYFRLPYIADTLYRLYAMKDEMNNNLYDPESDLIAFIDTLVRPKMKVDNEMPEMLNYEMKDTISCEERISEYDLNLFREKPTKQFIKNDVRLSDRAAYITFMAPNAWIDTMYIKGFKSNQLITEFNILQDSLLIWVNSRKAMPDTLHLYVNYRKTDSLGLFKPELEHIKLVQQSKKPSSARNNYQSRKNLKHTDTICVFKLDAKPENVEQDGIVMQFDYPIIKESFDSIIFQSINPRQRVAEEKFIVEQDTLNMRRFIIRPSIKLQTGFEYRLKVPHRAFQDINGFYSDSTNVKFSIPNSPNLSTLTVEMMNVDRKVIVDLMDEKNAILRTYVTSKDGPLVFPYLKKAKYIVRITEDSNKNSIVDVGSLLEHRQPERVIMYQVNGKKYIDIPESAEISQTIDLKALFK